jgi:hypothetical protein
MRKKSNPNEEDDRNKKGKNNTPKKSVIKRSRSKMLTNSLLCNPENGVIQPALKNPRKRLLNSISL